MGRLSCHAYEQAKWFGDDLALKADFRTVDFAGPAATWRGGVAAAYAHFRDGYHDMAKTLGFEGHIDWAEAMA